MKRVLLLGGTGPIGSFVAENCSSLGYEVFVTSRSPRFSVLENVTYLKGDAMDFQWLKGELRSNAYDAVVDFMVYGTQDFQRRIDFLLSNTDHYVFVSSYRVFCDSGLKPLSELSKRLIDYCEDKNYLETDEYALAKGRQENILFEGGRKNWTIVRPSITYALGRFQLGSLEANVLLARAKEGLPVVLPKCMMDLKTTMTWAGDVGKMIAKLLFSVDALEQDFNVATCESVTWRNVSELYHQGIGLDVKEVSIDDYLSLGLNPYQLKYDRLIHRVCSCEKILTLTGMKTEDLMPLSQGLLMELRGSDALRWSTYTRIHGRMDSILGVDRLGGALMNRKAIGYIFGSSPILNYIYTAFRTRRQVPDYKG